MNLAKVVEVLEKGVSDVTPQIWKSKYIQL
jgi:hypothetical protein